MATLADELLNDFEDSGSEADDHDQNGIVGDDNTGGPPDEELKNGHGGSTPGMELDGDEEEVSNAEEELATQENSTEFKDAPDDEETKARVEKMKLGAVSDVRSVAGLMKTLQPVLEVRSPL
jgi:U4/U6 small nuclear ribonucleoprotein PRP31